MTTTTTTIAELCVAFDVAVSGPLAPGAVAHRWQLELIPTGKFHAGRELKQARYHTACSSAPAYCVSWGWARQHGAELCPTCFATSGVQ